MNTAESNGVVSIHDTLMMPVSKDFFFEGMLLPVSVYLKMKQDTYVLIGKSQERVNFTELHSFKNTDTKSVYVKRADHATLIQFVTALTEKMMQQKKVPGDIKGKFLAGLLDSAMKSFELKGVSTVAQFQRVSKMILELGEGLSNFTEVLDLLAGLPNEESKHSMSTCLLSLMIAEEMGGSTKQAQEKLVLGALLHDIGLKSIPKAILDKPRHMWTPEELEVFEQHPLKGVELLRDLKDVPYEVLLIVAEHHENSKGTGFPKRIRDVKISPLSKIVGLANYFASLLFSQHIDGKDYSADEAINYIEKIQGQPFNKQAFLALKNVINKRNLLEKI